MDIRLVALMPMVAMMSVISVGAAGSDHRLLDAVKRSDTVAVRALLKQGVDVNVTEGDGSSALHLAAFRDDAKTMDLLLGAKAAVNAVNDLGVTPLWVASSNGNAATVTKLLAAGADPNTASVAGVTPLMLAVRVGSLDAVKALLTRGAHVDAKESTREQTALMWAVVQHRPDIVQVLMDNHADVHARSKVWRQRVLACCQNFNTDPGEVMDLDQGGYTAMLYAAQQGEIESAKRLLAAGVNVNDAAPNGMTALVIAAFTGRTAFAKFLLENGADVEADGAGYAALHVAVLRGDTELLTALLAHGAKPNVRLRKPSPHRFYGEGTDYAFSSRWIGATPFWLAAAFHDINMLQILVAGGADPQVPLRDRSTSLMGAVGIQKTIDWQVTEVRRALQQNGSIALRVPTKEEEAQTLEAVKFVVGMGVDLDATNDAGDTAIHRASAKRQVTVVEFLAKSGARLDIKNRRGLTPLAVALAEQPVPQHAVDIEIATKARDQSDAPRHALAALLRTLGATE